MINASNRFVPEILPRHLSSGLGKRRTNVPRQILRWLWAKEQAVMEVPPWLPFYLAFSKGLQTLGHCAACNWQWWFREPR
jgi:hypothetical protein